MPTPCCYGSDIRKTPGCVLSRASIAPWHTCQRWAALLAAHILWPCLAALCSAHCSVVHSSDGRHAYGRKPIRSYHASFPPATQATSGLEPSPLGVAEDTLELERRS